MRHVGLRYANPTYGECLSKNGAVSARWCEHALAEGVTLHHTEWVRLRTIRSFVK